MHVSAIDAPSDIYGAVSDVSRPLLYKMNQASMQRSTHVALVELLEWALLTLTGGLHESLERHERKTGVAPQIKAPAEENRPPESTQDARTGAAVGGNTNESVKSRVAPSLTDAVPLTLESLEETAEDEALEAEVVAEGIPAAQEPAVASKKTLTKPK